MKGRKAVFLITNLCNNKKYVGISQDIDVEWFNIKRNLKTGLGIRKMKEDFYLYGEENFTFEVVLESEEERLLNRRQSELAYEHNVWQKGYNTLPLLNYRTMTDEELAFHKLRLYKFIEKVDDGKYMFTDLLQIMELTKNDLEILFNEVTEEEMKYFKKRVSLKNRHSGIQNYYIQIRSV